MYYWSSIQQQKTPHTCVLCTEHKQYMPQLFLFNILYIVGQNWAISVLIYLENHKNNQLNAETKNQASDRHIDRVLGRLFSLILCG